MHENLRGDVVANANGTGALSWQAQNEAFGQQTLSSGRTLDLRKSNSKETDSTALVDEGWRRSRV